MYESLPEHVQLETFPCRCCGRGFRAEILGRHQTACEKSKAKAAKRGTFKSTEQRISELEVKPTFDDDPPPPPLANKKASWKQKHESFISAIRQARQVTEHVKRGGKASDIAPPPPMENPDYVQCPHCSRRFQETSANRHIPFCAEQAKRNALKGGGKKPAPAPVNKKAAPSPAKNEFGQTQKLGIGGITGGGYGNSNGGGPPPRVGSTAPRPPTTQRDERNTQRIGSGGPNNGPGGIQARRLSRTSANSYGSNMLDDDDAYSNYSASNNSRDSSANSRRGLNNINMDTSDSPPSNPASRLPQSQQKGGARPLGATRNVSANSLKGADMNMLEYGGNQQQRHQQQLQQQAQSQLRYQQSTIRKGYDDYLDDPIREDSPPPLKPKKGLESLLADPLESFKHRPPLAPMDRPPSVSSLDSRGSLRGDRSGSATQRSPDLGVGGGCLYCVSCGSNMATAPSIYCGNCGSKFPDKAKFCGNCGWKRR